MISRKCSLHFLPKNASTADEKYSEIDITYPLIKIGSDWKIVSLDDTTVKVMCANFKSVKTRYHPSLRMTAQIAVLPLQRILPPQAARPLLRAQEHPLILQLTKFSVRFKQFAISKDYGGNPCLMIYYDYTNSGDSQSSAFVDFTLQASQNGSSGRNLSGSQ